MSKIQVEITDPTGSIAIAISIIAIIVSIAVAYYEYKNAKAGRRIELEAVCFRNVFSKHLLQEVPKARSRMCFVDSQLRDYDVMLDEIDQIMRDALYFKYSCPGFYSVLKKSLQRLEDIIVNALNYTFERRRQAAFNARISDEIKRIYRVVNNYQYYGKKSA